MRVTFVLPRCRSRFAKRVPTAWFRSPLKRFGAERSGSAAVELAMVSVPFLALLSAIFDMGQIFFKAEYLQTGIDFAGRLIFTGQAQGPAGETQFKQKLCDALGAVITCDDVKYDVRTYTSFAGAGRPNVNDAGGSFDPTKLRYDPGARNSIVVITAYTFHGMMPSPLTTHYPTEPAGNYGGKLRIVAGAAFRNEPF